tara:strand:- start:97 stop:441 length:345 start_codon:yes stop_codon:yes gene_type:complete
VSEQHCHAFVKILVHSILIASRQEDAVRYVGLVFLGLVLWTGQASAELMSLKQSETIVAKGKTISEYYKRTDHQKIAVRHSRVVYNNVLFICTDYVEKFDVVVGCFSVDGYFLD